MTGLSCAEFPTLWNGRCEMRHRRVQRAAQNFPQLKTIQHFLSLLTLHCPWFNFVLFPSVGLGQRAQLRPKELTQVCCGFQVRDDLLLNYTTSFMWALSSSTYYCPHEKNPFRFKAWKSISNGQELELGLSGRKLLGLVLKCLLQVLPSLPSFLYSHRY